LASCNNGAKRDFMMVDGLFTSIFSATTHRFCW
jgi:hypothetical protein